MGSLQEQPRLRRSRSTSNTDGSEAKARRIEQAVAQTESVIDSITSVNGDIIDALREKMGRAIGSRQEWRAKAADLQEMLMLSHHSRGTAELRRIHAATTSEYQKCAIEELEQQMAAVGETAVGTVTTQLAASTKATIAALETRASQDALLTEDLVRRVQTFMSQSMSTLTESSSRTLAADLEAAGKDVTIARLQTALTLELARHSRYYDEVDALMRIVATLAERSQKVDTTREELARAKEHVRRLENALELNGIVAAIAPPDTIPLRKRPKHPWPAPSPELKTRTPHYFAIRMLEHKDITISELVDAWLTQEERVVTAENRYAELQDTVQSVRRDAMLVHQQYLEEKQRREIADRRITEMIRERVRGGSDGAVAEELNQLRWSYSQVLDDAAQLAVSLKMSREELVDTQTTLRALQQRVRQLERDAQTDQVAATLTELRDHYQQSLESLRADFTEAELQRRILSTVVDRQAEAHRSTRKALDLSRDTLTALGEEVRRTVHNMNDALASLQSKVDDRAAEADGVQRTLSEKVRAMREAVEALQSQARRFHAEQDAACNRFGEEMHRLISAVGGAANSKAPPPSPESSGAAPAGAVARGNSGSATEVDQRVPAMRSVLHNAMVFVAQHLESADAQQTSLLDASISDAEYVAFLVRKLRDVTEERDALRAKHAEARAIIDQNHLTLVGQALMHEVSVQDSIDAAEAAEKIASLQEQLAATQMVRHSAVEEIKEATSRREELEAEVTRLSRENARLRERYADVESTLKLSKSREAELLAAKVALQSRVLAVVGAPHQRERADNETADEDGNGHAEEPSHSRPAAEDQLRSNNTLLEDLLLQFDAQLNSMTAAIHEATEKKQTPSAGGAVDDDGGHSDDAEKAIGDYLARTGLNGVVKRMTDVLLKAGLLKHSMGETNTQSTMTLVDAANGEEQLLSPQMRQTAAKEHRLRELEEGIEMHRQERATMEQKLAQTTEAVNKATEQNHKLLDIIKKLTNRREADAAELCALRFKQEELEERLRTQKFAEPLAAPHEQQPGSPTPAPAVDAVAAAVSTPGDASVIPAAQHTDLTGERSEAFGEPLEEGNAVAPADAEPAASQPPSEEHPPVDAAP